MGIEIERKFLVEGDAWRGSVVSSVPIRQGYMRAEDATLRVRIKGEQGIYTVKGRTRGITRGEWQWPIPREDAEDLLRLFCEPRTITKTRHTVIVGEHEWVVDVFEGRHAGLVLAEVELDHEDEPFELPAWAGPEVSHDARYYNAHLAGMDGDENA